MTNTLSVAGKTISLDKEGYLEDLADWTPDVANALAERENLTLTTAHWEVITLLRDFHAAHGLSPMMRVLVKQMKSQHGADKGSSMYLMTLFPEYPALIASKIAGLPRPTHCP